MTSLPIVFGIVIALGAMGIVFALVNWFVLHSLSARLNSLDQEIEKKSAEFDSIRKERLAYSQQSYGAGIAPASRIESSDTSTAEIQVVRNVRDGYESASGSHLEGTVFEMGGYAHGQSAEDQGHSEHSFVGEAPVTASPYSGEAVPSGEVPMPASADTYPTTSFDQNASEPAPSVAKPQPQLPVDQPAAMMPSASMENADVMDVVGEQQGDADPLESILRIPVYSDQKKDADFQRLSVMLKEGFPRAPNPSIILDFARVNFIYEKELLYLEKLAAFAEGRHMPLLFVNCDRELLGHLAASPSLAAHVRG